MKTRLFRNSCVFKSVTTTHHWVLQNHKGDYFDQFVTEHGYTTMRFVTKLESASPWSSKREIIAWLKKNDPMGYSMSKPVKVVFTKEIKYQIV